MYPFSTLYLAITEAKTPSDQIAAMARYFRDAPLDDAAWAIYFLTGRRVKRIMHAKSFELLAVEASGLPDWLFNESRQVVRDLAETAALILPSPLHDFHESHVNQNAPTDPFYPSVEDGGAPPNGSLSWWIEENILPLQDLADDEKARRIKQFWMLLNTSERLIFNKLVLGSFRLKVKIDILLRALEQTTGISTNALTHRLSGTWIPTRSAFEDLIKPESFETNASKPHSLCYPAPLETPLESLGDIAEWQIERKWNGLRTQLIRRNGMSFIWSNSRLLTRDQTPDLAEIIDGLPDGCVLDGELVAWKNGAPQGIYDLDNLLARTSQTAKNRHETSIAFITFDVIELDGKDMRRTPLRERRTFLEDLAHKVAPAGLIAPDALSSQSGLIATQSGLLLSAPLSVASWDMLKSLLARSRDLLAEGFVLKRLDSTYEAGAPSNAWVKWVIEPMVVDAVLIYAQRGSGRDPSLYAEYTLGLWSEDILVPIAKVNSTLPYEEIFEIDQFIRANTLEKFGPVRTVKPTLLMRLAFDEVHASTRRKSGLSLKSPRLLHWQRHGQPEDAANIDALKSLVR